ncbi:MAG: tetratricopeptide repeat protein, partial [Sphingomicrobium sp.]
MRIILALSPDSSSEAFLREVDENLRRDQAQAFAKRYGTMLAGGVLLFLAAIAGWLYWQDRQAKAAGADSETLSAAMTDIADKRTTTVRSTLDKLANSASEGISTEARLAQASVALAGGNRASAIAIYRSVADDSGLAGPFRDLAT